VGVCTRRMKKAGGLDGRHHQRRRVDITSAHFHALPRLHGHYPLRHRVSREGRNDVLLEPPCDGDLSVRMVLRRDDYWTLKLKQKQKLRMKELECPLVKVWEKYLKYQSPLLKEREKVPNQNQHLLRIRIRHRSWESK
jgi:hypothetical protein